MNPHTPTPKTTSEPGTTTLTPKNAMKNAYALGLGDSARKMSVGEAVPLPTGDMQAASPQLSASSALRIWVAMRLAKDVDTCCSLLRGEAVDPARLDDGEFDFARRMRLVRLDVRAIQAVEDSLRRHHLVELVRRAA